MVPTFATKVFPVALKTTMQGDEKNYKNINISSYTKARSKYGNKSSTASSAQFCIKS
jgi:hypothetical protein